MWDLFWEKESKQGVARNPITELRGSAATAPPSLSVAAGLRTLTSPPGP